MRSLCCISLGNGPPDQKTLPKIPPELIAKANNLYLYLMQSPDMLGVKLERVYRYLDDFRVYLAPHVSCNKGCSHCCHMDVQLSPLEASLIQMHTGITMQLGNQLSTGHRDACPFLASDGACSVYQVRPMVCRTFHALGEPENCKPGRQQLQYGHPPTYGNDIFANLFSWISQIQVHHGWQPKDIRDFFRK